MVKLAKLKAVALELSLARLKVTLTAHAQLAKQRSTSQPLRTLTVHFVCPVNAGNVPALKAVKARSRHA